MELSVSTIVVIVLAMSMLILGLMLIRNIFSSAENALKMTDDQLMEELKNIYGKETEIGVTPSSKKIDVRQGEPTAFGIGITNLRRGASSDVTFSYVVEVSDSKVSEKCDGYTKEEIESLISVGQSEEGIPIASGQSYVTRVTFETQIGDPLCLVRFRISAKANDEPYGSPQIMDVNFIAGK